jgi:hypothetical protein
MAERKNVAIIVLSIVVIILAVLVLYEFVISPAIQGYAVQNQQTGVQYTVGAILSQIQQYGYVQIPLSENQTLILVPYNPQQQTQQPTQ